ncbi:MAG TPA: protein translocase subunit SecF [Dermatophilaceae bacterium]|nr:protein translocase subunit SecF [Dermatophilaceae bacterium]
MSGGLAQLGNDLYTGRRSIDFVGRQRFWYAISAGLLLLAAVGLFGRHLNLGLEFRGGSEFRVSQVASLDNYEQRAKDAVGSLAGESDVTVTTIGTDGVRVQTEQFNDARTNTVKTALARTFGVATDKITSSEIGPSWGASISNQAVKGLVVFLVLVSLVLAAYFRTWKMALSALVALVHDLLITVGIYALAGFEVTPASVIGFLTILGYSLYDTVVVFDKVRENTNQARHTGRRSYSQAANLAVNQTLVRSINTSVVALLPVTAILVVGFSLLGPGTLLDLSLALFVGIATGTYSSIFIATPLLADLREREPAMKDLARRAQRYQQGRAGQPGVRVLPDGSIAEDEPSPLVTEGRVEQADAGAASVQDEAAAGAAPTHTLTGREIHRYAQTGPRNQPRRQPKSKR